MINSPEDIEGKSIEELQKLHREISFQLKIINNSLKEHNREIKFRQFFEKYPFYLKDDNIVKADVDEIIDIEQAGFGYDKFGMPVWGPNYGAGGPEYTCLEKEEDQPKVEKLRQVILEVVELHNKKSEPAGQKQLRLQKILEGYSV